ncbi:hypothetical protein CTAYLR_001902 [Chrysophaeum taylorii]|uniref:D-aminoacyl-tRNA deacylase n=1 Tax=Chrysophaeum taylorii TaxID=2483200 RepID=A0AAD7U899_9STRA|nr:hypothetical protein CTAYLR_001902 [Chrysophaeum taylorii]
MKLVIQRVLSANVRVEETEVSSIGRGVVVLVGIGEDDTELDVDWCVSRITKTSLWPEHIGADPAEEGKPWQQSVASAHLDVLCVSQFTLCGVLKKKKGGVSFHRAMRPERAKEMYETLLQRVRTELPQSSKVEDGVFGARMHVSLVNDGPVTLSLDSRTGNGTTPVSPGTDHSREGVDNL